MSDYNAGNTAWYWTWLEDGMQITQVGIDFGMPPKHPEVDAVLGTDPDATSYRIDRGDGISRWKFGEHEIELDDDAKRAGYYSRNYIAAYPGAVVVDDVVILTEDDFGAMAEYSTSYPTYLGVGKCWKCNVNHGSVHPNEWWLVVVTGCETDSGGRRSVVMHPWRISDRRISEEGLN